MYVNRIGGVMVARLFQVRYVLVSSHIRLYQ